MRVRYLSLLNPLFGAASLTLCASLLGAQQVEASDAFEVYRTHHLRVTSVTDSGRAQRVGRASVVRADDVLLLLDDGVTIVPVSMSDVSRIEIERRTPSAAGELVLLGGIAGPIALSLELTRYVVKSHPRHLDAELVGLGMGTILLRRGSTVLAKKLEHSAWATVFAK